MRFIAVIVFLIVVAVAVAWFVYQNLDGFGQTGVMRWLTVFVVGLTCSFSSYLCRNHPLQNTES